MHTLEKNNIPLNDCRGQGYDNGSNMAGAYKGTQSIILKENSLALFSPCACHNLNLCGVHAAECCPKAVTFFGTIQKLYNLFSSSPQRWVILKENIKCSLYSMSNIRWSARVESVKPFIQNLCGILKAINGVMDLNLTAEVRTDLTGIKKYINSYECLVISMLWLRILTAINYVSTVL